MEKALLINKNHFDVREVNFKQLKDYTNNIILEHVNNSGSVYYYFKRSLFTTDLFDYNVGILLNTDNILSEKQLINNLVWNIKGFDIKLGIWIKGSFKESVYNALRDEFKNNFILGLVDDKNTNNIPRWGIKGDIEENKSINIDFIENPVTELILNTDYKKIYEENKLTPIPSSYV